MASDAVVNLVVNAAGADAEINAQLRRITSDAERRAPTVDVRVSLDTRRMEREFGILGTRIDGALGAVNTSIQDGFQDLTAQLTTQLNVIGRQLGDVNRNLNTTNDRLNDLNQNDGLRRVADDADDADDSTRRLSDTFRRVGSATAGLALGAARMTLVAGAASGAIPVVAALATSLASLAPAAAAGVTAFLTVKAAALTLKLGLTGVQDAISAVFDPDADPEAVAKALDRLSTNARAFVGVLQKAKPAFDKLRLDVQDRLFQGLDKTLERTGKAAFPVLRRAALDFSGVFNRMAKDTGQQAQELAQDGTLGKALKSGSDAFGRLERIPGQVLNAILKLSVGGGPLLNRLTERISEVADSLTRRLDKAAESGSLQKAIDQAGKTLAQLGRIAGNVFQVIGNVLGAASVSGDGLFGTLERVTQALADLTASKEFQDTLGSLISLGTTLATTVLPLLLQAFSAVAPVIQLLAPALEDLVKLLGDGLGQIIPALAPVIEQVAVNFVALLTALTPLIEQGLRVLVAVLPSLLTLFQSTNLLITELTPLIEQLAPLLAALLTGAIVILVGAMSLAITTIANLVVWIKNIIGIWKDFAGTLIGVVQEALKVVGALLRGDFSGAWQHVQNIVGEVAGFIGRTVGSIKDTVLRIIGNLAGLLPGAARTAFNGIVTAARQKASEVLSSVNGMTLRIVSTIASLGGRLYEAGQNMISSLARGILSQLGDAVSAAQRVVGAVRDLFPSSPAKKGPFSGRGYTLYSGRNLIEAFAQGITQRSGVLENALATTLGAPVGAASLTGDLLGTSGVTATPGGALRSAASTPARMQAPGVTVYLGNELVRRFVRVVVDESTADRDRLVSQGVRN